MRPFSSIRIHPCLSIQTCAITFICIHSYYPHRQALSTTHIKLPHYRHIHASSTHPSTFACIYPPSLPSPAHPLSSTHIHPHHLHIPTAIYPYPPAPTCLNIISQHPYTHIHLYPFTVTFTPLHPYIYILLDLLTIIITLLSTSSRIQPHPAASTRIEPPSLSHPYIHISTFSLIYSPSSSDSYPHPPTSTRIHPHRTTITVTPLHPYIYNHHAPSSI